jgi:hypothetical protein
MLYRPIHKGALETKDFFLVSFFWRGFYMAALDVFARGEDPPPKLDRQGEQTL